MDIFRKLSQPQFYLLKFFALTYAFSWLLWLPGVLATRGVLAVAWQETPLDILAGFGPSLAAFWLTGRQAGKAGVRQLLRSAFHFRISRHKLLFIFLAPPVLVTAAILLGQWIGAGQQVLAVGMWQIPDFLPTPLFLPLYFLYSFVFLGPLGEEFGWRGYALDRLQARWSPLTASLILGILWGMWHLPLFWLAGTVHSDSLPLGMFVLSAVFISTIITWLYNDSGKNLLTALLFHQIVNFTLFLNPAATTPVVFTYLTVIYGFTAFLIVIRKVAI